ncbi:galactokinase-like [Anastrepha ludens]|uniref:galactokinase-like n=1 Tax=Anastrepha ludens TaxID=28586 RepID=UPI0023B05566|nr:galactokinase-like [Anastrepha ludens]XP_053949690.1 galactokinase-like [Anastrepha ludens]XP_053949692.1 galactokinase-like [Anastrepha ludens]
MPAVTKLATFEEILTLAKSTYHEIFGADPEVACCAPGRVNLIGEHIDYNDGFVLPMALPMVTLVVGGRRTDTKASVFTHCGGCDDPKHVEFSLNDLKPELPKWANYVKGVIYNFATELKLEGQLPGFNAVFASNVPVGGGLSSSAAVEMATLTFMEQLTGKQLESNKKRALVCQAAEHKFAGMPCGIMDQMISIAGQKDHALLLDCRSLDSFQIPFIGGSKDLVVLICNSGVRHELSQSEYPTRRRQCAEALKLMEKMSYRDAKVDNLSVLQSEPILLRRARHVITETKRTQDAAEALKARDFTKMGALMKESHTSLRDDFEVSCRELDVLVDAAINCSGVLGSRMTGGGFGGCTVTLLQRDAVDDVIATMRTNFNKEFNKDAAERLGFYTCVPSNGARRVDL